MTTDHSLGDEPAMFDRPSEAPAPLTPIRSGEQVTRLHSEWRRMESHPTNSRFSRRRRQLTGLVNRALGRGEHEFLADLVRAIDAVAERCDEIAERLQNQQRVTEQVATTLGTEVTQLRAALLDVARRVAGPHG